MQKPVTTQNFLSLILIEQRQIAAEQRNLAAGQEKMIAELSRIANALEQLTPAVATLAARHAPNDEETDYNSDNEDDFGGLDAAVIDMLGSMDVSMVG